MRKTSGGFTLLEQIAVIAILTTGGERSVWMCPEMQCMTEGIGNQCWRK
jgi:hypothetical protein